MLGRILIAYMLLWVAPVGAATALSIHATCATELAGDPSHVRTLRAALKQAFARVTMTRPYTLDVSLVRLGNSPVGNELEVRAEVRTLLSDAHGVRWSMTSHATVRGRARDRAALQRDAVIGAAHDLAAQARVELAKLASK